MENLIFKFLSHTPYSFFSHPIYSDNSAFVISDKNGNLIPCWDFVNSEYPLLSYNYEKEINDTFLKALNNFDTSTKLEFNSKELTLETLITIYSGIYYYCGIHSIILSPSTYKKLLSLKSSEMQLVVVNDEKFIVLSNDYGNIEVNSCNECSDDLGYFFSTKFKEIGKYAKADVNHIKIILENKEHFTICKFIDIEKEIITNNNSEINILDNLIFLEDL